MAMKVDRFAIHFVPSAEWVVAKNEQLGPNAQFLVVLDARPSVGFQRGLPVVVAYNEMFPSMKPREQARDFRYRASRKVTQVPDLVVFPHSFIPEGHEMCIVIFDRFERSTIYAHDSWIPEVGITGEQQRHGLIPST
jgi:hypothetical protein